MDSVKEQELRTRVEQETRMEIARKMREDGLGVELIHKYTGIRLAEKKIEPDPYDLVARQVAAEMLMRGLPISSIQLATRLPYEAVLELKQQYAAFFGGDSDETEQEGPPAW